MPGKRWTDNETQILLDHRECTDWELLFRLLPGRNLHAIQCRRQVLKITSEKGPPWTDEQRRRLAEMYPTTSVHVIAKSLGRTVKSVETQATRMRLRKDHKRVWSANRIARLLKVHGTTVLRWIRLRKLPASKVKNSRCTRILVLVEDLVEFLPSNPDLWDSRNCPDLHIKLGLKPKRRGAVEGERPLWLKEKIAADRQRKWPPGPWTGEADAELASLMKRGWTYKRIGQKVGRGERAVSRRVYRLGSDLWKLG